MTSSIDINPDICHGNPVIRGTRVTVAVIVGALGGGDSVEDVLSDYPGITRNDICAALAFAGNLARFETVAYDGSLA